MNEKGRWISSSGAVAGLTAPAAGGAAAAEPVPMSLDRDASNAALDRRRRRSDRRDDAGIWLHWTDLEDRQRAAFSEVVDHHWRRADNTGAGKPMNVITEGGYDGSPDRHGSHR
jgi:hypothetical protein